MAKQRPQKKWPRSLSTRWGRSVTSGSSGDFHALIDVCATVAVKAGLVFLYGNIGGRICADVLKNKRTDYGDQNVATPSRHLAAEFGKGFGPGLCQSVNSALNESTNTPRGYP